jgi:hypothetical protein
LAPVATSMMITGPTRGSDMPVIQVDRDRDHRDSASGSRRRPGPARVTAGPGAGLRTHVWREDSIYRERVGVAVSIKNGRWLSEI